MAAERIPTVKFDASRVNEAVRAELSESIRGLKEIDQSYFEAIYDAALRSVSSGRDLNIIYNALMQLSVDGMTKLRASEIALLLNNKATSRMDRERLKGLGVKHAVWVYSGAPCGDPADPAGQDALHKGANKKQFEISNGMLFGCKWTWPGVEAGCRCIMKPVIPGLS